MIVTEPSKTFMNVLCDNFNLLHHKTQFWLVLMTKVCNHSPEQECRYHPAWKVLYVVSGRLIQRASHLILYSHTYLVKNVCVWAPTVYKHVYGARWNTSAFFFYNDVQDHWKASLATWPSVAEWNSNTLKEPKRKSWYQIFWTGWDCTCVFVIVPFYPSIILYWCLNVNVAISIICHYVQRY